MLFDLFANSGLDRSTANPQNLSRQVQSENGPLLRARLPSPHTNEPSHSNDVLKDNVLVYRERNIQFMKSLVGVIFSLALFTLFAEKGFKELSNPSSDCLLITTLVISSVALIAASYYGYKLKKANEKLKEASFEKYQFLSQEFKNTLLAITSLAVLILILGELGGGFHHFKYSNGYDQGVLILGVAGGVMSGRALKVAYDWKKSDRAIVEMATVEQKKMTGLHGDI